MALGSAVKIWEISGLRARPVGTQACGGSEVSFVDEAVDSLDVSPLVELPLVGALLPDCELDSSPVVLLDA